MTRLSRSHRRAAFTLVEMLVASALIISMMYVIASAFEKGLVTFRLLKAAGDVQERLRTAATVLRLDLTAKHFDAETDGTMGGECLSSQRLDDKNWHPPTKGYFRIDQGNGLAVTEGVDPDNTALIYKRATPQIHSLLFTVKLDGLRRDQYASAATPAVDANGNSLNLWSKPDYTRSDPSLPGTFNSTWSEVAYYLAPIAGRTANGTQLYGLFRRQRLLIDEDPKAPNPLTGGTTLIGAALNAGPAGFISQGDSNYLGISFWRQAPNQFHRYNTAIEITAPIRRFGSQQTGTAPSVQAGSPDPGTVDTSKSASADVFAGGNNSPAAGSDLLLSDVIDFQVKVLWDSPVAGWTSPFNPATVAPPPSPVGNPDYPFDVLPFGINPVFAASGQSPRRVFDTWSYANDDPYPPYPGGTYNYGLPAGMPGQPTDPLIANWNQGHFTTSGPATAASVPLRIRVRALQIKIRIWDERSQQTRQLTIIQDV